MRWQACPQKVRINCMNMQEIKLNIYGVEMTIASDDNNVLDLIRSDFKYFATERSDGIMISISKIKPPYDRVPPVKGSLYTPAAINYDSGNLRYSDYYGKALTIYDYDKEKGEIFSENEDMLYEIAYLMVLSRSGELLDKKGIHRVHALGFSNKENGFLLLLPMKGGKTTLAIELLKSADIKLLSEDTPLIDRDGKILPFPLRLGIQKGDIVEAPTAMTREFRTGKGGEKILVDVAHYMDKIGAPCPAKYILIGEREFSDHPRIMKAGKLRSFSALTRNLVFGLGLPQVVEYFLRSNLRDIFSKAGIFMSRMAASIRISIGTRAFRFILGRDRKRNAETLLDFMKMI